MSRWKIVLVGGPEVLPQIDRVCVVDTLDDPVKVCFGGGYEHFVYQGGTRVFGGQSLPMFQWTQRTKIAE
jgi:hypothetical protein